MDYHRGMNHEMIKKRRMEAEMDKFEEEISKPIVSRSSDNANFSAPPQPPTSSSSATLSAPSSLYQFIPHQIQRQVPSLAKIHTASLPSNGGHNQTTVATSSSSSSTNDRVSNNSTSSSTSNNKGFTNSLSSSGTASSSSSSNNQGYTVTLMGLPPGVTLSSIQASQASSGTSTKKSSKNADKPTSKVKKSLRMAGGQIWEDNSLLEWDPDDFRLFVGDLGNDVTDDVLTRGFSKYPSFVKAKVVRDKRTNKSKGYGFVSFKDPNDYIRAMREMDGKYLGSRPIKLRKSTWKERNLDNVRKKMKEKAKLPNL